MLLSIIAPQPPYSISFKKSTTLTIRNQFQQPILFRFNDDGNFLIMPTYGLLQPQESKKIKVNTILTQFVQQEYHIHLQAIQFVDELLQIDDQDPLFWREKHQANLITQSIDIPFLSNSDSSSLQSSGQKPKIFDDPVVRYVQPSMMDIPKTLNQSNNSRTINVSIRSKGPSSVGYIEPLSPFHQNSMQLRDNQQNEMVSNNESMAQFPEFPQNILEEQLQNYSEQHSISQASVEQSRVALHDRVNSSGQGTGQFQPEEDDQMQQSLKFELPKISLARTSQSSVQYNGSNFNNISNYSKVEQEKQEQLKQKQNRLEVQIGQLTKNKQSLEKELQELQFLTQFKNKENNPNQQTQIYVWHMFLVSVIALILGASIKRISTIM